MSLSLINHLLQSYGYFAGFAFIALESPGVPLPGESTLIAAAVSFHGLQRRGGLGLVRHLRVRRVRCRYVAPPSFRACGTAS
jgi:hypothetical protein